MLSTEGYTVSKWQNNVDLERKEMHAARWNRFNALSTGFPDFVAFRNFKVIGLGFEVYSVIWVEAKKNGLLRPDEKKKMQFMEDRGMECWIAYDDKGKVGYRKFVDYIESGRVRGKEVKHQIG